MNVTRRHDIDALRALAFAGLILYHVGMFYVSWDWHVKSAYEATWLEPIMIVLNQWRMPLIFVISGLALTFLMDSARVSGVAWHRVRRLLPPLVFGMLIIVPPQAYYEALANGATPPGYGSFVLRYFGFAAWPDDAFAGSDIGVTWNHLWYLPYLLLYSLATIAACRIVPGPARALRERWCARRSISVYLIPVAILIPIGLFVFPLFPYVSHDLMTDGYAHAMYGTFFLLGFLTGRDTGLWCELARLRWWSLGLAIVAHAALRFSWMVATEDPTLAFDVMQAFVVYLNRWAWIVMVMGFAHQHLNRPLPWLGYASRAVFPWYVLHQSITVVAGANLSRLALGPVVEPILVVGLTIGGCALGMFIVERYLPWLRRWVGLKPARGQHEPRTALGGV